LSIHALKCTTTPPPKHLHTPSLVNPAHDLPTTNTRKGNTQHAKLQENASLNINPRQALQTIIHRHNLSCTRRHPTLHTTPLHHTIPTLETVATTISQNLQNMAKEIIPQTESQTIMVEQHNNQPHQNNTRIKLHNTPQKTTENQDHPSHKPTQSYFTPTTVRSHFNPAPARHITLTYTQN